MRIQGFTDFPNARAVLEQGLSDGVFPGCVAGVWQASAPDFMSYGWGGERRLRLKGLTALPMERETIFDLASVTKIFGTAGLAMSLIERGWIQWDTPVTSILPSFRYPAITLRQLAAHTSGLPAWFPFFEKMREHFHFEDLETISVESRQAAMRRLVYSVDLERAPGTKEVYSDVGFLLLGFCLEEITGLPLDQAVQRFLWNPMGLEDVFYERTVRSAFRARNDEVAATEDCPWRKAIVQGQVHDDNTWAMGGYAGHAGAFGNARSVLTFGKKLLEGYFTREVTAEAWTRVKQPEGCTRTPGWDTPSGDAPAFGKGFSRLSVGHLGFTGTSLWIDTVNGIVVTILTNRVHPLRENQKIKTFRGVFHEALAKDLTI